MKIAVLLMAYTTFFGQSVLLQANYPRGNISISNKTEEEITAKETPKSHREAPKIDKKPVVPEAKPLKKFSAQSSSHPIQTIAEPADKPPQPLIPNPGYRERVYPLPQGQTAPSQLSPVNPMIPGIQPGPVPPIQQQPTYISPFRPFPTGPQFGPVLPAPTIQRPPRPTAPPNNPAVPNVNPSFPTGPQFGPVLPNP